LKTTERYAHLAENTLLSAADTAAIAMGNLWGVAKIPA